MFLASLDRGGRCLPVISNLGSFEITTVSHSAPGRLGGGGEGRYVDHDHASPTLQPAACLHTQDARHASLTCRHWELGVFVAWRPGRLGISTANLGEVGEKGWEVRYVGGIPNGTPVGDDTLRNTASRPSALPPPGPLSVAIDHIRDHRPGGGRETGAINEGGCG